MGYTQIHWWDKKSFARSSVAFLFTLASLLIWIEQIKASNNFTFEELPIITGTYKCCAAGGRYSASWVSTTQIACDPISYWGIIGTPRNDCDLNEALNGRQVDVKRVLAPLFGGSNVLTTKNSSGSQTFYDVSDKELHRLWVKESRKEAFSIATILFIAIHFFQPSHIK